MNVIDICLVCDTVECGYRIAELADGRYAFVWGNIECRTGRPLAIVEPTAEKGVMLHADYDTALKAWSECAEALADSGAERAAEEMREVSA